MRFAVAGALFMVALACQIWGIVIFSKMMADVNRLLPPDARIPEVGPSWLRGTVITRHRQYYPNSSLRRSLYCSWWATTGAFVAALACVVRFV
jgi:hypothetical protein